MAWKQKITEKTLITASALALCLAAGSNAVAADVAVRAEVSASSSTEATYGDTGSEARTRSEAAANAGLRAESDGGSAAADADAESAASTRVDHREPRSASAHRASDSDGSNKDRSEQAFNADTSLIGATSLTAAADDVTNTATQETPMVADMAISTGSRSGVHAITETRHSVNAVLSAMPESETDAEQGLEPPAAADRLFAGNADLVGQAATAITAAPTPEGDDVPADAVTTPNDNDSVAVATTAAGEALLTLAAAGEGKPAIGTDLPSLPDQPLDGDADLLASAAGQVLTSIDGQSNGKPVEGPAAPAVPDHQLAGNADLTNTVVAQANGMLQSDGVDVAGHAVATVSTATNAATEAAVAEQAAAAVQSTVTSDIAGAVNADVANEVRDAISTEIASDISNSLPLTGSL